MLRQPFSSAPTILLVSLLASFSSPGRALEVEIRPESPTDQDVISFRVVGESRCHLDWLTPVLWQGVIRLYSQRTDISDVCPGGPWSIDQTFLLGPMRQGVYPVEVASEGQLIHRTIVVSPPGPTLRLLDDRFEVFARFFPRESTLPHLASARPLTERSGVLWFFERENAELTVKLVDGRVVNDRFWLFVASLTDLGYEVVVRDYGAPGGASAEDPPASFTEDVFEVAAGTNQNILDVDTILGSTP